jgi:hypothetical protein
MLPIDGALGALKIGELVSLTFGFHEIQNVAESAAIADLRISKIAHSRRRLGIHTQH